MLTRCQRGACLIFNCHVIVSHGWFRVAGNLSFKTEHAMRLTGTRSSRLPVSPTFNSHAGVSRFCCVVLLCQSNPVSALVAGNCNSPVEKLVPTCLSASASPSIDGAVAP
jgi:hypothetical protein